MDNTAENQKQTISDDQELAKALAGVTEEANNMGFEETGAVPASATAVDPVAVATQTTDATMPDPIATDPNQQFTVPEITVDGGDTPAIDPELASVKQAALVELRPLIDKLDVEPEEKFNTYLLLIRSTDDKDLIAPAHEAAKGIVDEAKKAQALLDIIKEIDFLANPKQ